MDQGRNRWPGYDRMDQAGTGWTRVGLDGGNWTNVRPCPTFVQVYRYMTHYRIDPNVNNVIPGPSTHPHHNQAWFIDEALGDTVSLYRSLSE